MSKAFPRGASVNSSPLSFDTTLCEDHQVDMLCKHISGLYLKHPQITCNQQGSWSGTSPFKIWFESWVAWCSRGEDSERHRGEWLSNHFQTWRILGLHFRLKTCEHQHISKLPHSKPFKHVLYMSTMPKVLRLGICLQNFLHTQWSTISLFNSFGDLLGFLSHLIWMHR